VMKRITMERVMVMLMLIREVTRSAGGSRPRNSPMPNPTLIMIPGRLRSVAKVATGKERDSTEPTE